MIFNSNYSTTYTGCTEPLYSGRRVCNVATFTYSAVDAFGNSGIGIIWVYVAPTGVQQLWDSVD